LVANVSGSPILTVGASGVTIAGNLNITGSTTETTIESSTVQVGDKNIVLGYGGASLAEILGAGLTIGNANGGYTLPTLMFTETSAGGYAWESNYDLRCPALNLSDKWRLKIVVDPETEDERLAVQYADGSGGWTDKFYFSA
jgi:hypothetical protein